MRCLVNQKLSMNAELLHWTGITEPTTTDVGQGTWDTFQDPITGEIRNEWKADEVADSTTGEFKPVTVPCMARGVISQGVYASGSYENFGTNYINGEIVRMWLPANINVSKRDRVTNIRDKKNGKVVFLDEDYGDRPTIYNVQGVTPMFDGFNRHIQNYVLLQKAES